MARCVGAVMGGRGAGACVGLKEARCGPLLLIADAVVQAVLATTLWYSVIATLWTFSTRAVADGALLRSASLDRILQRHRYRIKDWRYSPAAPVCDFHFVEMATAACCDFVAVELWGRGNC